MPSTEPGRHWPRIIIIGLGIVVAVNVLFAYIAISGADTVVSSYRTEAR